MSPSKVGVTVKSRVPPSDLAVTMCVPLSTIAPNGSLCSTPSLSVYTSSKVEFTGRTSPFEPRDSLTVPFAKVCTSFTESGEIPSGAVTVTFCFSLAVTLKLLSCFSTTLSLSKVKVGLTSVGFSSLDFSPSFGVSSFGLSSSLGVSSFGFSPSVGGVAGASSFVFSPSFGFSPSLGGVVGFSSFGLSSSLGCSPSVGGVEGCSSLGFLPSLGGVVGSSGVGVEGCSSFGFPPSVGLLGVSSFGFSPSVGLLGVVGASSLGFSPSVGVDGCPSLGFFPSVGGVVGVSLG